MDKTLDDALAGNLDAIDENLRQMIGSLHKVDTTGTAIITPKMRAQGFRSDIDFVEDATLDRLAHRVLRSVHVDGRVLPPRPSADGVIDGIKRPYPIGQHVSVLVQPGEKSRACIYLVVRWRPKGGGDYVYMSPPALAVRAWAKRWLAQP